MDLSNLSEISWDERGQWQKELKVTVCVLIALMIITLLYYLIVKPQFETYETLLLEEAKLKSEFQVKYNQIVNLAVYEKQLNEMQARFGLLLKQLPTENQMPGLLADISKTGTNVGLMFKLFEPQKEIEHPYYVELPVKIEVVGNYHQLAVFESRVSEISRIITLHDFEITQVVSRDNRGDSTSFESLEKEILDMKITIKIYRYRS